MPSDREVIRRASMAVLRLEARKLAASPAVRIASAAAIVLTACTTIGGYAAAHSLPGTDAGRKAAALLVEPGWPGYVGLAALGVGVTTLLVAGIVMAWAAGREFIDGTVVGLFAVPPTPARIGAAKAATSLAWALALGAVEAVVLVVGGIALGLPAGGALSAGGVIAAVAGLLGAAALPVMWIATLGRGYLAGVAAALGLVVATNLATGFGIGAWVPWAVPVLWATPGSGVAAPWLVGPAIVVVAGAGLTVWAWARLRLGAS